MRLRNIHRGLSIVVVTAIAALLSSTAGGAGKDTKGKPKPGGSASASASASSAPSAPSASASVEPIAPPVASASASAPPAESAPPSVVKTPVEDPHDPTELAGKRYFYVGLRYRGTIMPQFLMNFAVTGGQTLYLNGIGVELDWRTDGFSRVIAIHYADYNTGDMLFLQGDSSIIGNYSLVNSSLKALYASVDLLWSVPLGKTLDFEYGAGLGIGATFGSLEVIWVKLDPTNSSPLVANGQHYVACAQVESGTPPNQGCKPEDHKDLPVPNNKNPLRVGGYNEPGSFNGGNLPPVLPYISLPQLGLRYHPVKELETRLAIGVSPYGFYFQLSGNYGLPIGAAATKAKDGPADSLKDGPREK
jgi:hypothetical protein